jgi:hypothetical protein
MYFLPQRAEANLQAEFYHQCKLRSIPVFLEYRSIWNEMRGCRFDAVIHHRSRIIAIVEIKAPTLYPQRRRRLWGKTKQAAKYRSFGLPVFLLISESDFKGVFDFYQNFLGGYRGDSKCSSLCINIAPEITP